MGLWDSILGAGATIIGSLVGGAGGNNANNASQTQQVTPW